MLNLVSGNNKDIHISIKVHVGIPYSRILCNPLGIPFTELLNGLFLLLFHCCRCSWFIWSRELSMRDSTTHCTKAIESGKQSVSFILDTNWLTGRAATAADRRQDDGWNRDEIRQLEWWAVLFKSQMIEFWQITEKTIKRNKIKQNLLWFAFKNNHLVISSAVELIEAEMRLIELHNWIRRGGTTTATTIKVHS